MRELPADARPLVKHLVDQRLLVSELRSDGETTVEVSHEAVLRHWSLLGRWIGEEREALTQVDAVMRAATDWRRATPQQQEGLLLHRAERLADAEKLLQRQDFAELIGPEGVPTLQRAALPRPIGWTGNAKSRNGGSGMRSGSLRSSGRLQGGPESVRSLPVC